MSGIVTTIADLEQIKNKYLDHVSKYKCQVLICGGAGCISSNCAEVKDSVIETCAQWDLSC